MATTASVTFRHRGLGRTSRRDAWWLQPLVVLALLSGFIVYATWAAFQGNHYTFGPYLSPFYSPELFGDSHHAVFGPKPGWWPGWLPFSPAILILWAPAGFRFTCYYYRGAYYKAFWADPLSCTVSEKKTGYTGEHGFPLIIQNIHRYMLYLALIFLVILTIDVWKAMWFEDPTTHAKSFGIGVGTLILLGNVVFLGGYTLGCHSLRHLVGGYRRRLTGKGPQDSAYRCVSCLNRWHMRFAWTSLIWVALSDVYIRLCSHGVITDWRIL